MLSIEMLPALNGDCLWITYGTKAKPHHVLIDGGYPSTTEILKARFEAKKKPHLDLMMLTHVDEDHIYGSIQLFAYDVLDKDVMDDVWFNGWKHLVAVKEEDDELGAKQGEYFSSLIDRKKLPWNKAFGGGPVIVHPNEKKWKPVDLEGGMKLTVLSPSTAKLRKLRTKWKKELQSLKKQKLEPGDLKAAFAALGDDSKYDTDELGGINVPVLAGKKFKEDTTAPNGSSIAVLAEYDSKKLLLTGDAHPSVIQASLEKLGYSPDNRLELDVLKLSHHGSKANISPQLLALVDYEHVLVSSNGDKFDHPDAEAIARVVHKRKGVTLHFNYETDFTKPWLEKTAQKKWKYTATSSASGLYALSV